MSSQSVQVSASPALGEDAPKAGFIRIVVPIGSCFARGKPHRFDRNLPNISTY